MPSKSEAQSSAKALAAEAFSLTPSSLVILFEIDIQELATDRGLTLNNNNKIFRFHNSVKLLGTSIFFGGNEYIAAPIVAHGFETNAKGTIATPKLSISVNDAGVPILATLKSIINALGDLTGAKVTRRRTFAKFIDARNFNGNEPEGFTPDPYREFSKDIFYIDRKTNENRFGIEFELASILDVEGVRLPARVIAANRCVATYRGEGCMYEFEDRRNEDIHGIRTDGAYLPITAPPIATKNNEKIKNVISPRFAITATEAYNPNKTYQIGSAVYITKNGINYYFVAKVGGAKNAPPFEAHWVEDSCSQDIIGCQLRWGVNGSAIVRGVANLQLGVLPFVGFPGADKVG